MKKILFLAMVVAILALMTGTAWAGGWWKESNMTDTYTGPTGSGSWTADDTSPEPDGGVGIWSDQAGNAGETNPHKSFSSSTNKCKTCHAVHLAVASYRLLKNGNTTEGRSPGEGTALGMGDERATECMYCHDATVGMSEARPYALGVVATVRGEHTVGATVIPDATTDTVPNRDPSGEGAVLQCYQCHSVHNAGTLDQNPITRSLGGGDGDIDGNTKWVDYLLRTDPNKDGLILAENVAGSPTNAEVEAATDNIVTAFCADCHTKNSNFQTTDSDPKDNQTTHIQGPADDGTMEVYGDTVKVAFRYANNGCRNCHYSSDGFNMPVEDYTSVYGDPTKVQSDFAYGANATSSITPAAGSFPHQSQESKFLLRGKYNEPGQRGDYNGDGNEDTAGDLRDSNRALGGMDKVCFYCHRDSGNTAGVGLTF